jgi:hypothetical protein
MKNAIRKGPRCGPAIAALANRGNSEGNAGSARQAPPRPRKNRRRLMASCRVFRRSSREIVASFMVGSCDR